MQVLTWAADKILDYFESDSSFCARDLAFMPGDGAVRQACLLPAIQTQGRATVGGINH